MWTWSAGHCIRLQSDPASPFAERSPENFLRPPDSADCGFKLAFHDDPGMRFADFECGAEGIPPPDRTKSGKAAGWNLMPMFPQPDVAESTRGRRPACLESG